jgi:predicted dehydrogenase
LDSFEFGRQEVLKLGRILGFRVKMFANVQPGGKYYGTMKPMSMVGFSWPGVETAWRKKPEYQGGFLLDGGVHFVAGTRLLLGEDAKPTTLTAFTALLREHLPPVDTVNAVWQTKSGISGTFSVSFGTTLSGSEYVVACEKGSVTVGFAKVTVRLGEEKDNKETVKEFKEEGSGVKQEVAAWAKSISDKTPNPRQSPEQALADIEILEKMLKSGEGQGKAQSLKYQV